MADLGQIPEIPVGIEEKGPSKGGKILKTLLTVVIGIVIGGATVYFVAPLLNILVKPGEDAGPGVIIGDADMEQEIARLKGRLGEYTVLGTADQVRTEKDELTERRQAQGTIEEIAAKLRDADAKEKEYDALTRDVENLNERIASAQETLEVADRQIAEGESRLAGLRTEIVQLEGQVGKLEVADARRQAVKAALLRDVEQLMIQIRKSIPITPPEYRKQARIARAQKIRNELENSNWVRPALLEEYTQLHLEELQMATQERYFIAKIPLMENKKPVMKWAECVSIGNRLAYFETLDRNFTGVCRNTNPEGAVPRYELIVDLPRAQLMRIRDIMAQYRPEDYEDRIRSHIGDEVELGGSRPTVARQSRAS